MTGIIILLFIKIHTIDTDGPILQFAFYQHFKISLYTPIIAYEIPNVVGGLTLMDNYKFMGREFFKKVPEYQFSLVFGVIPGEIINIQRYRGAKISGQLPAGPRLDGFGYFISRLGYRVACTGQKQHPKEEGEKGIHFIHGFAFLKFQANNEFLKCYS
jgi:hypothetical protein